MNNRRQFLKQAAALSAAGLTSSLVSQTAAAEQGERSLQVYNIHTGESANCTFWANGQYIDEEIQMLDFLVRDHRANQTLAMQRELYENMYYLQELFGHHEPLYIISGYRAPKTNSDLRHVSNGVAEHSLHM
ncbi:MAG: hypothetical protein CMI02_11955, partial [Oceanospirillaceae bacterium]|nr:hypothetical protein [Oceanospirillaceae bacterium]